MRLAATPYRHNESKNIIRLFTMARLIPPLIAVYKYDGEQDIAQRLQQDAATANWMVRHSLDVAVHRSQMIGEYGFISYY
jgi:hypothetical protein